MDERPDPAAPAEPNAGGAEGRPESVPPGEPPVAPPPTVPVEAGSVGAPPPGDGPPPIDAPPVDPPPDAGGPEPRTAAAAPGPSRWQLRRSVSDRKLKGVAGGVAAAADIDATLVRILFAVAALSGWGLVAYVVLAIVLKDETADDRARPLASDQRRVLRVVLAVAAVIAAGRLLDGWFLTGSGMGLPFVLIVAGAAVLWARREQAPSPPAPATAGGAAGFSGAGHPGWSPPPWPAGPLTAPPDASVDWRSTGHDLLRLAAAFAAVLAFLVLLGGTFLVIVGAVPMRLPFLPATVALIGLLGLIVGVVRKVRVVALLLSGGVLVAAAMLAVGLSSFPGGAGDRTIAIGPETPLQDRYEQSAGRLVLDLTDLDIEAGGERRVVAEVGAGQLTVIVPASVSTSVRAEVGAGTATLFGREQSGAGVTVTDSNAGQEGGGRLALDLHVGVGQIKVERPTARTFSVRCQVPLPAKGDGTDPVTCPHPPQLVGEPMACSVALVDPDGRSAGRAFCRAGGNFVPAVGRFAVDCVFPEQTDTATTCSPLDPVLQKELVQRQTSMTPTLPTSVVPPVDVPPLTCGPPDPAGVRMCTAAPTTTSTASPTTAAPQRQYRCTEDPSTRQLTCAPL
jgi:phage shock protein PspC (stress-responsive transcriptional regulator)